jgi:hypothetical protein
MVLIEQERHIWEELAATSRAFGTIATSHFYKILGVHTVSLGTDRKMLETRIENESASCGYDFSQLCSTEPGLIQQCAPFLKPHGAALSQPTRDQLRIHSMQTDLRTFALECGWMRKSAAHAMRKHVDSLLDLACREALSPLSAQLDKGYLSLEIYAVIY